MRFLIATTFAVALAGCAALQKDEPTAVASGGPVTCGSRDVTVYFEDVSTELSPGALRVIDTTVAGLKGCRITQARIIGSTDVIGADAVNEEIAGRRAKVMADYLVEQANWPREAMVMLATGERGAVTDDGLNVPMRRRARIVVEATAP